MCVAVVVACKEPTAHGTHSPLTSTKFFALVVAKLYLLVGWYKGGGGPGTWGPQQREDGCQRRRRTRGMGGGGIYTGAP